MRLDRQLQRELLEYLRSKYPEPNEDILLEEFKDREDLWGNVKYLMEYGLIEGTPRIVLDAPYSIIVKGITAKGLDFLEDDGGLGAILGTVTVRFDAESLRELIEKRVLSLNLPHDQKETALAELKKLPVEALKIAVGKLLERGLECIDVVGLLRLWSN